MRGSKYTRTYINRIDHLIHIAHETAIDGVSTVVSFIELKEVGERNTYKAVVVFNSESILHGNAAHLIPLVNAIQHIVANKYVNLCGVTLVLTMDKECNVELMTKEIADERRAKKVKATIIDLRNAVDEKLQQAA